MKVGNEPSGARGTSIISIDIIEDIDKYQDRHAEVKLPQELALQFFASCQATEFRVRINVFGIHMLLGGRERRRI
jgi:hypothetical protein